jgi:hypothetical protein
MMKINPIDQVLQGTAVSAPKAKPETTATSFADILSKTTRENAPKQVMAPPTVQPIIRPPMATQHGVYAYTERMLDAMENYQRLLGDQRVNLRRIEPAVDQMKREMVSLEPMLQGMDENDPVAQIAREAVLSVNKEIARFETGQYVEGE